MYKNNSRNGSKYKGYSPLQLSCNLIGLKPAIGYYSYVCREAVNGKYKSLHAVIEMVEPVLTIDVGISRPTEVVLQERASNHLKVL